jgi:hypothetical protein
MSNQVQETVSREASDIEQRKVGLMDSAKALADSANLNALSGKYLTPDYQVAGMSPDQLNALDLGRQGIGAYQPYMSAAAGQYGAAGNTVQQGIDTLLGADTRGQFTGAQAAMNRAAAPIELMGKSADLAVQGVPLIGQGAQGLTAAQQQANQYAQANMGQSLATLGQAEKIAAGATPTNFGQAMGTLGQGIGALQGAAQMYDPSGVQKFMNPYQQQVIDESIRQINRQGDISQQNLQAQAVRAGAFGGSREGVQRAELQRALGEQKNAAIVGGLSQGYNQAATQAQQAFEAQQGRQLAQAQGLQGAAGLQGQFGQTQQQQALQQAQALQGIGGLYGQQSLQQAQLGQGAAGLQGSLSNQLAGLSSLYGNAAGQQANIYGQQSQLGQSMAQGIGNLATQQFGIGRDIAQGLGALGAQQGNLATQGAALGQAAQGMGQQDTNFLYNLGSTQQRQLQSELDASRQNELTKNMQPYQQMGFVSDIYRGAPTSQMAVTTQSQATPSPFAQAAGLGIGAVSAAAAAGRSGII